MLARLAAVLTGALGVIVLAGWVFGLPLLKSVLPGAVEMKANTAVGLVLAGCALFILGDRPSPPLPRLAQALALAVAALGLATLGEYLFGWQLGIDELLFRDTAVAYNVIPGRMSPYSAVAFAIIGLALAALPRPSLRPLTWSAAIVTTAIGALSFLGYLWNASELVTDLWLPPVAVNTAVAFILLGAGTLLATRNPVTQQGDRPITPTGVETRILAGFIAALLLLTFAGGLTYRGSIEFTDSARRVSHTQQVRVALGHLYGDIADAESAQRNYLITGQRQQLDDYTRLAAKLKGQQDAIARLVTDNPDQLQKLAELKLLIDRVTNLLERGITLYQQQGFTAARELVVSGQSFRVMQAILTLTERVDAVEEKLLMERDAALTRARQRTLVSLLLTLVVATIGFVVLYRGIRREMTARNETEQALVFAYDAAIQRNKELARSQQELEKRSAEVLLANRFLDSVIENIPDMIFVKNAADLRYIRFNDAGEKLLGYSRDDLVGKNDYDFFPREEADFFTSKDREVLAGGVVVDIPEEPIHTRNKGDRILHTKKIPILDEYDRPSYLLGISEDVTEKKIKERENLRLNAALEQYAANADTANRAKSTFLATMSHEIRTPLNGLLGMLELLGLSRLDGEQREALDAARDSGHGLVRIIDDVLDHAKIEAGKLDIRPEPVSIAQLLRRVLNTYSAVASAKGLMLTKVVDARISPALMADPLRVLQILGNFVSNALKFTAEGHVEVRAELIGREGGADTVRLSVKDTGIGIEPEVQERLFQPFEQAGAVTARLYGGTGLGLSISRRLAKMMGGIVVVESAPGEGTTMSVTLALPISEAAPAEYGRKAAAPPPTPASDDSPLVLAVDDHPTNRALLARQLAVLGCRVKTATDGQGALALWQAAGFALVITDCNMPVMDGYALSRAIREIEAKEGRPRTPIVAWTANVLPAAAAQCRAAGMDDILTKPAELVGLKEVLSKWLPAAAMVAADTVDARHEGSVGTQAAPIDLAELHKIAANAADRTEILRDFTAQTRSDLTELEAALKKQDLPATGRVAHRIKGASRMVGARELAAVCETIEHAARQGDPDGLDPSKVALDRALERLETHLAEAANAAKEKK